MRSEISKFTFLIGAAALILGCANTPPTASKTVQVTILSPMMKINDVGFLHVYKKGLNLQIYSSGLNTANIKISGQICVNRGCFAPSEVNKKFFLAEHYDEILSDILQGREIFNGAGLSKTACGFEQNISANLIKYEVCGGDAKFSDAKNRVKVILKELK